MRLTKSELIAAMHQCFKVYQSYVEPQYRYDNLTATMAFVKGEHTDYLGIVNKIEKLYEAASKEQGAYAKYTKAWQELERFAREIPNEVWIF